MISIELTETRIATGGKSIATTETECSDRLFGVAFFSQRYEPRIMTRVTAANYFRRNRDSSSRFEKQFLRIGNSATWLQWILERAFRFFAIAPHRLTPIMRDEYVRAALEVVSDPNVLINVVSRRVKQLKRGNRTLVESLEKLSAEDTALREIIERKISYELATPAELALHHR
jgi:DNA-directed RNA polymerase subunit omega